LQNPAQTFWKRHNVDFRRIFVMMAHRSVINRNRFQKVHYTKMSSFTCYTSWHLHWLKFIFNCRPFSLLQRSAFKAA